tara:strand:- start:1708 stop:1812 length:105 start_codon:yes stop_codon:yes gene_type:complete
VNKPEKKPKFNTFQELSKFMENQTKKNKKKKKKQ